MNSVPDNTGIDSMEDLPHELDCDGLKLPADFTSRDPTRKVNPYRWVRSGPYRVAAALQHRGEALCVDARSPGATLLLLLFCRRFVGHRLIGVRPNGRSSPMGCRV